MTLLRASSIPCFEDQPVPNLTATTSPSTWIYVSTVAWEGFDLPGPKSIVIPFVPNPVPTDPAFQIFRWQRQTPMTPRDRLLKRTRRLRSDWMIERAQQGVGRAIRTVTDHSVVYWLDPRMRQPYYHDPLREALPQAPWAMGPTADEWSPWLP